jgi:mono/diheme cytochrome c family protein
MVWWCTLLVLTALAEDSAPPIDPTAAMYVANCGICHGENGDGKGPAGRALRPPPTDFTDGSWWEDRTDDQIKMSIQAGKPGTPMMGFPKLSLLELRDLTALLRTFEPVLEGPEPPPNENTQPPAEDTPAPTETP